MRRPVLVIITGRLIEPISDRAVLLTDALSHGPAKFGQQDHATYPVEHMRDLIRRVNSGEVRAERVEGKVAKQQALAYKHGWPLSIKGD